MRLLLQAAVTDSDQADRTLVFHASVIKKCGKYCIAESLVPFFERLMIGPLGYFEIGRD